MKKLFSVLAVLFVIGTANLFAVGLGAQGGCSVGDSFSPNGAITFKVDSLPCVFAVDANFGDVTTLGVSADWWIANPKIQGTWGYYYGVGLYGGLGVGGDNFAVTVGPRAFLGTNVFLINSFFEIYLQGGWEPTFTIGDGGFNPNFAGFFGNLGFRFWF